MLIVNLLCAITWTLSTFLIRQFEIGYPHMLYTCRGLALFGFVASWLGLAIATVVRLPKLPSAGRIAYIAISGCLVLLLLGRLLEFLFPGF